MDQGDSIAQMEDDQREVEEDVTDARSGGGLATNAKRDPIRADIDTAYVYNMNYKNRGLAVIINNRDFAPETKMNKRSGTDVDAANLYQRFSAIGFNVQMFHNQTTTDMMQTMDRVSKFDHSDNDCFACAILSHGDDGGIIYGTNGTIRLDQLTEYVKGTNCKSLLGKPKLFIIQACRGNTLDHGVDVGDSDEADSKPPGQRIPFEADILLAFSTVPGYYSWRNSTKGSWFVQAFNKIFEKYGNEQELMWLLTRINHAVAFEFESNASQSFMNEKKQIPCIQSMLTKHLYFTPKK